MAVLGKGIKGLSISEVEKSAGILGKKGMLTVIDPTLKDIYPFPVGSTVPVKVTHEYPKFYVCDVLPHISESSMAFAKSKPYRISVDKFYFRTGAIKIAVD